MPASLKHKLIFSITFGLALGALLIVANCTGSQGPVVMQSSLTKKQIGKIAIKEVKKREQWDTLKISFIERQKDKWFVIVVGLPETPGWHSTVLIAFDGKVIGYVKGN